MIDLLPSHPSIIIPFHFSTSQQIYSVIISTNSLLYFTPIISVTHFCPHDSTDLNLSKSQNLLLPSPVVTSLSSSYCTCHQRSIRFSLPPSGKPLFPCLLWYTPSYSTGCLPSTSFSSYSFSKCWHTSGHGQKSSVSPYLFSVPRTFHPRSRLIHLMFNDRSILNLMFYHLSVSLFHTILKELTKCSQFLYVAKFFQNVS